METIDLRCKMQTNKNVLNVFRKQNNFTFRRETVETLDPQEFITTLRQMREQKEAIEKQLKDFNEDLAKMEKWEVAAKKIRADEVAKAKEERQSYMG